jgi:hypothetical protein
VRQGATEIYDYVLSLASREKQNTTGSMLIAILTIIEHFGLHGTSKTDRRGGSSVPKVKKIS